MSSPTHQIASQEHDQHATTIPATSFIQNEENYTEPERTFLTPNKNLEVLYELMWISRFK